MIPENLGTSNPLINQWAASWIIGPKMWAFKALILWTQLREALLISPLLVFLILLQSLSFLCFICSSYSIFHFFMLFTQVLLIASFLSLWIPKNCNTCTFSLQVISSHFPDILATAKLHFGEILYHYFSKYRWNAFSYSNPLSVGWGRSEFSWWLVIKPE